MYCHDKNVQMSRPNNSKQLKKQTLKNWAWRKSKSIIIPFKNMAIKFLKERSNMDKTLLSTYVFTCPNAESRPKWLCALTRNAHISLVSSVNWPVQ